MVRDVDDDGSGSVDYTVCFDMMAYMILKDMIGLLFDISLLTLLVN